MRYDLIKIKLRLSVFVLAIKNNEQLGHFLVSCIQVLLWQKAHLENICWISQWTRHDSCDYTTAYIDKQCGLWKTCVKRIWSCTFHCWYIYMYMNYSSDHQLKSCNVILKQLLNNILHHYFLSGFNTTVCGLHHKWVDITVIGQLSLNHTKTTHSVQLY